MNAGVVVDLMRGVITEETIAGATSTIVCVIAMILTWL